MNLLNKDGNSNGLSNFSDPFGKDCVETVRFFINKQPSFFKQNKRGSATVSFKKGSTSGEQEFFSDDFQDLVKQVDDFIKSLK